LSSQVSQEHDVALEAWINFLRAHSAVTRQFNAELQAEHGLTLSDFEVLAQLARAPERSLKRVDLAERVLLTPSGITRLLKGLERAGYVCNRPCAEDARVTYAVLTDEGHEKFKTAARTHRASVRALLTERFEHKELGQLAVLLGRLPLRGDADACE
jgi:DNA-binding MarR family transcriptional regulator